MYVCAPQHSLKQQQELTRKEGEYRRGSDDYKQRYDKECLKLGIEVRMSRVTDPHESCPNTWVMSHMWLQTTLRQRVSQIWFWGVHESSHTYAWVMSQQMSHVPTNESCPNKWVMSQQMSHVPHMTRHNATTKNVFIVICGTWLICLDMTRVDVARKDVGGTWFVRTCVPHTTINVSN